MEKVDQLIRTKLRPPAIRPGLVARPRLQDRLTQGLCLPLTLITAPAGFGKSTLVGSALAACGRPVAWLSLDKEDNHAGRFARYVVAAVRETDGGLGIEAERLAAGPQQAASADILTSLINDLDAAGAEMVLVLDDYQFIDNRAVHEAVAFLLEHCPHTFHLVIATRSDPALPLARLRASGQTVELRAADLGFTEPEATQFLNDVMGLHLDAASIAVLNDRTEGWIAGLQMAALSMRDRKDVPGFIEGFSGTNRYILDYLLEEVLANQPPEIQRFLLRTSVLDRLTAPLCDALLEGDEPRHGERPVEGPHPAPASRGSSVSVLEYLERANLFLVPLDDERIWYRYHHLFAELLQTQLQKTFGEKAVGQMHLRAAAWYEQNALAFDAIRHASLVSDDETVERLIEENYLQMMNRGEMSSLRSWTGKLSKAWAYRRPWLAMYEAFSRSWFGKLEEARLLLDQAEKRIRSEPATPETRAMLGYHAYVLSRVTAMEGDTRRAIELCRSARDDMPAENLARQIEVGITLGYEYFLYGDFANAVETLEDMIRTCLPAGAVNNPVAAYCLLARVHIYQGRLHEAHDVLQKAAMLIHESGGQSLGVLGLVEVGLAPLLYEWNDLDAAVAHARQGLALLPSWGKADDLCLAYFTLWRIELALGNRDEAQRLAEKAVQLSQAGGLFSEARSVAEAAQVHAWLAQGDWPALDRWAAALVERVGLHHFIAYEDERALIMQVRVLTARDRLDEALDLLTRLEESTRRGGRNGRLIRLLLLKALALQRMGDTAPACAALAECLALAQPSGYVRTFLDEGRPVQALLARWLAGAAPSPLRDYAGSLLAQFGAASLSQREPETASAGGLLEPLSQRELEVLQLIALGRTNQEVASQLIVAQGTVKAHTASIYRKLDVANRTEAVARARQLGILP